MKNIQLTEKQLEMLKKKLKEQEEIDDEETETNDMGISELGSILLHSQSQTHVFHLQTDSYAEHKALQKYYEGIDPLLDSLIEAYQGEYEIVQNYKSFPIDSYNGKESMISYFDELIDSVREITKEYPSYLKNIVDEIEVLITSTLYKLKKLK